MSEHQVIFRMIRPHAWDGQNSVIAADLWHNLVITPPGGLHRSLMVISMRGRHHQNEWSDRQNKEDDSDRVL